MKKLISVFVVFAIAAAAATTYLVSIKTNDPFFVDLTLTKTAEEVYTVDSDIYWAKDSFKLVGTTQAPNIGYKKLETPENLEGLSMRWINTKGVDEGTFASYKFQALKPMPATKFPEPSLRVYNKEGVELASTAKAEMEVQVAERDAVVVTFRTSPTAGVNSDLNDTVPEKK